MWPCSVSVWLCYRVLCFHHLSPMLRGLQMSTVCSLLSKVKVHGFPLLLCLGLFAIELARLHSSRVQLSTAERSFHGSFHGSFHVVSVQTFWQYSSLLGAFWLQMARPWKIWKTLETTEQTQHIQIIADHDLQQGVNSSGSKASKESRLWHLYVQIESCLASDSITSTWYFVYLWRRNSVILKHLKHLHSRHYWVDHIIQGPSALSLATCTFRLMMWLTCDLSHATSIISYLLLKIIDDHTALDVLGISLTDRLRPFKGPQNTQWIHPFAPEKQQLSLRRKGLP